MADGLNKVTLIGYVGFDPEVRRTQDGRPICNIRLATSESWKDKATGEKKEKTEWHRVVVFHEGLARVVEQYVKKGARIYIEGALQTRKWTDQNGIEKYTTEVVLQGFHASLLILEFAADKGESVQSGVGNAYGSGHVGGNGAGAGDAYGSGYGGSGSTTSPSSHTMIDDEIPF